MNGIFSKSRVSGLSWEGSLRYRKILVKKVTWTNSSYRVKLTIKYTQTSLKIILFFKGNFLTISFLAHSPRSHGGITKLVVWCGKRVNGEGRLGAQDWGWGMKRELAPSLPPLGWSLIQCLQDCVWLLSRNSKSRYFLPWFVG